MQVLQAEDTPFGGDEVPLCGIVQVMQVVQVVQVLQVMQVVFYCKQLA